MLKHINHSVVLALEFWLEMMQKGLISIQSEIHAMETFFFEILEAKLPTVETRTYSSTLQGTNISPKNGILKMIFLFPRWDMLIPWRVVVVFKLGHGLYMSIASLNSIRI